MIAGLASQLIDLNIKTHRFLVAIDGYPVLTQAGFSQVQGLEDEIQASPIDEPGVFQPHNYPVSASGYIVTLIRGVDFSRAFSDWIRDVRTWEPGQADYRKNMSIYLMHVKGRGAVAVRGWDLYAVWPLGWRAPDMNANQTQIAFESIRLYCESKEETPLSSAMSFEL